MTIEQIVDIPSDGWFHLDLPPELAGTSGKIVVTVPLASGLDPEAAEADRRVRAREAVKRCAGIAGRMGFTGSSDDLLAERRKDRERENVKYRAFTPEGETRAAGDSGSSLDKLTTELRELCKGSTLTVDRLLAMRREEREREEAEYRRLFSRNGAQ